MRKAAALEANEHVVETAPRVPAAILQENLELGNRVQIWREFTISHPPAAKLFTITAD
jgi:hypothetical protein